MKSFRTLLATAAVLWAFVWPGDGIRCGQEAAVHSRPYMASVQEGGKHECGGFLVASQWVMSAAHCFRTEAKDRKIVLGVHSLSGQEDSKVTLGILAVYPHPDFSTVNYDSDIALVKLDQAVEQNDKVKIVAYQKAGGADPAEGEGVDTAGWGSINNRGSRPDKLQEVTVSVMRRTLCGRSDYYGKKFTENMICAAADCRDTCDGDSGGPLLYNGVVVGITSNGGKKCGTSRRPGLYTFISKFSQWVEKTMADNA
ncbi:complement factor D [Denticeps clupeoides]|uniref:trypsin n=1 Tax=Denticeps clupeoides TaxID=299321 RepID=A0AAY4EQP4_9TELE|nr:complement factor D-like [Denticeps clupeoides]